MGKLASQRLAANAKQSLRYLRLVFNDFFVLALVFLLGALMFWYAQAMKTMPVGKSYYPPILAFLLWLPCLSGRLVTLLRPADQQFLLTQDRNFSAYLRPLYWYSLLLPTILLILMGGILFPFATIKIKLLVPSYLGLLLCLWLLKAAQLLLQAQSLYFGPRVPVWIVNLLLLAAAWLWTYSCWVSLLLLVITAALAAGANKRRQGEVIDWPGAIQAEARRKSRVYAFYSLFTDVDERQVVIKRRKWLDFLLPRRLRFETPQTFLYRRTLLRNPEYANLLARMTAFAWLISWLVQDYRWALGLSALVLLLTLYQLEPLGHAFDYQLLYQVMPINDYWQRRSLIRVLSLTLELQTLVIILGWAIVLPKQAMLGLYMIFLLAIAIFLVRIYLPLSLGGQNAIKK